jgi:hypothetical protein
LFRSICSYQEIDTNKRNAYFLGDRRPFGWWRSALSGKRAAQFVKADTWAPELLDHDHG